VITRYPKRVLAIFLLAVLVAILFGLRIELRDSRADLASGDDPEQARFDRLIADFHGSEALVVAVEPLDAQPLHPAELRSFTDQLATRLQPLPEVDGVFHKVEIEPLLEAAFWLAPPDVLEAVAGWLESESQRVEALFAAFGPAGWNRFLVDTMQAGRTGLTEPPPEAVAGLGKLVELLRLQKRFLEDPSSVQEDLQDLSVLKLLASAAGEAPEDRYLETADGRTLFMFVSPADTDDTLLVQKALIASVRQEVDRLLTEHPGFQIALTGQPALVVEEMAAIASDTWRTSALAVTGVFLLTLLVFRWKVHALLVLLALAAGVALALGAVYLELGYLNLITSSFISTLIGVGIAYGIHPVSEYELLGAHTGEPQEVVVRAYRHTGSAVMTAGVTTAAAFFSILLMRFKGFAELGLVAGGGVLLCLLAMMVMLPALLVVHGRWRKRRSVRRTRTDVTAAMDRLWLERGSKYVCRYPRIVSVVALVITLLAGWAALGIRFDTNILKLVPADLPSVRYQEKMMAESDFSPVFGVFATDTLEELPGYESNAAAEETISRFDSLLQFLPADAERSAAVLAHLEKMVQKINIQPPQPVQRQPLLASLLALEESLEIAADETFVGGYTELTGPLEEALIVIGESISLVENSSPAMNQAWDLAVGELVVWLRQCRSDLEAACRAPRPTVDTLPRSIRDRFMTKSGRYLAFLQPTGDVFDPSWLEIYVAACRRVFPEVTGFPIVFHHMSGRITSGFYRAVTAGGVLVFLILMVDYRRLGPALQALLPLGIGLVWMLGGMRLLGLSFNFANLVAVPLIIGVGIDNGVHVVHRLLYEGAEGMSVVLRHTGRAILIASLTTMIGFGSLAAASHRGMASLGVVLILGVGSCLVTSTVVLPNLLVAFRRVKR